MCPCVQDFKEIPVVQHMLRHPLFKQQLEQVKLARQSQVGLSINGRQRLPSYLHAV
jgi:hypothetical protein